MSLIASLINNLQITIYSLLYCRAKGPLFYKINFATQYFL